MLKIRDKEKKILRTVWTAGVLAAVLAAGGMVSAAQTVTAETSSADSLIEGTSLAHPWNGSAEELFSPAMNRYMIRPLDVPVGYMTVLRDRLLRQLNSYDGTWSVYMKDLTSDEELIIGDQPMNSASTMKLFILGAVYQAIDEGSLERTSEVVERMSSMIRSSSNTAANDLIFRLGGGDFAAGIELVNRYIVQEGYSSSTVLYNGFQEESLHLQPDMLNATSAKDVGLLLERVYHRNFGRRAVCMEIEEWMLNQDTRYKIPKGLPDTVLCGNKTGETDSIENDCAVIYTPLGDYILCVFSSDWEDKETAQRRITDISSLVYRYFSGSFSAEAALHIPGNYEYADSEENGDSILEDEDLWQPLSETEQEETTAEVQKTNMNQTEAEQTENLSTHLEDADAEETEMR